MNLRAHPSRVSLGSLMTARQLLPWVIAFGVLTGVGAQAVHVAHRDRAITPAREPAHVLVSSPAPVSESSHYSDPVAEPAHAAETRASRRDWCEPLELPLCQARGAACPDMPDGTSRRCQRQWLRPNSDELVCTPSVPGMAIKNWRRARLRTIVDSVCKRSQGCAPGQLDSYLGVLAMRETSLRPWKMHRLGEDADAAKSAWARRHEIFADSPAHDQPWRWQAGVGYYGQNPALWLDLWDASAEPETLCGEIEATIVHLRAARRRHSLLVRGVECDGEIFHGTGEGGAPSWYDISLVNSGSGACPATDGEALAKRKSFERRCERVGLDPYAPVSRVMLGLSVHVNEQEVFASKLRERLAIEHPQG